MVFRKQMFNYLPLSLDLKNTDIRCLYLHFLAFILQITGIEWNKPHLQEIYDLRVRKKEALTTEVGSSIEEESLDDTKAERTSVEGLKMKLRGRASLPFSWRRRNFMRLSTQTLTKATKKYDQKWTPKHINHPLNDKNFYMSKLIIELCGTKIKSFNKSNRS